MTTSNQTARKDYLGDGVTTLFSFPFEVFQASDLAVYVNDVLQLSGYTVALNAAAIAGGVRPGGSVTFSVAPANLARVALVSAVPFTQPTAYPTGSDKFPAVSHENGLDRAVILCKQMQEELDRVFRAPIGGSFTDFTVPGVAGGYLQVKGDLTGLQTVVGAITGLSNPVTTRGDLIRGGTAGVLERLPLGTSGHVVKSNGTDTITGQVDAAGLATDAVETAKVKDANITALKLATLLRPALHGKCRLTKSGANLLLSPHDGNTLVINSVIETIPDAGVTLAPTGATPDTTYYIYAFMSAGVMTLERSTTASAVQAGTGVRIKSGDATRTLVGMARAITGPAWVDTDAQRFVLSWFNRRTIGGLNTFAADRTTASTTFVELSSTERAEFLTWADEAARLGAGGRVSNGSAAIMWTAFGIDGTTAEAPGASNQVTAGSGTMGQGFGLALEKSGLAEGYHYATLLGKASAGTGTWTGSATVGERTHITVGLVG